MRDKMNSFHELTLLFHFFGPLCSHIVMLFSNDLHCFSSNLTFILILFNDVVLDKFVDFLCLRV